ncbi:MAG TPA: class I SAM-dependent methyltransferase [Thermoanaerobaculia bacterium]|nr:class I SAM-dependent methyltransferase [Thermoanaerobaculia bacterium]
MPYAGPDPQRIRSMFAAISARYDRANTVLSAGVHHHWRRQAVRWSGARAGDAVLDCATGTGDLAIAFRNVGARVVATDFVPEMLAIGRTKAPDVEFRLADVMSLPFDDAAFDAASIAFGIRNVADPAMGMAEMARVVKPGGRVMVLELGSPPNALFRALYDTYRRHALPRVGGVLTGQRGAYEYLETSSADFPCGEAFAEMMRRSGRFARVEFRALTFGIAYLYRGVIA